MRSKVFTSAILCLFVFIILNAVILYSGKDSQGARRDLKLDEQYNYRGYNLILISLGNVGAKYMSLYGYNRKTTPFLDEWSKDAIVFNNAYVPASWTLPVGTSLFTSLQPYSHKVYHRRFNNILDKDIRTLPEILKAAGYKTAAFTGGLDYDPHFGHMRGFQSSAQNKAFTSFVTTFSQSQEWLNDNKNSKFFLFIHGYDTHCPFDPPDQFEGIFSSTEGKKINIDLNRCYRCWEKNKKGEYITFSENMFWEKPVTLSQDEIGYLRDLYDEEVRYEDYLVGRFLNSLDKKLLAKTIIIIIGDHGELFAKQGRFGRAGNNRFTFDDDVVHIPLIIKLPDRQTKRVDGFVQLIDLMPTVLRMLNLSAPSNVQGKDLTPLINNGRELNRYVFGGTKFWATMHYRYISTSEYIRDKDWKLVHESRRSLKINSNWLEGLKQQSLGSLKFQVGELGVSFDRFIDIRSAVDWLNNSKEPFQIYANHIKINGIDQSIGNLLPLRFEKLSEDQLREQALTSDGKKLKGAILNQFYPRETPRRQNLRPLIKLQQSFIDKWEQNPIYSDSGPKESYKLYNIRRDPDEMKDLYKSEPDIAKTLREKLNEWTKETSDYTSHNASKRIFSDTILKLIKGNGYW